MEPGQHPARDRVPGGSARRSCRGGRTPASAPRRGARGLAADIDPDVMPSVERRSRLWVEVARGHLQRGDRTAALHVMGVACKISQETVAYTPSAREVAADLWRRAPRAFRDEAARLA